MASVGVSTAVVGLVGVVLGSVSSILLSLITDWRKRKHETEQLQAALVTEIAVIVEVAEARHYREGLKQVCNYLETQPEGTTYRYIVIVPEHYSRIYQANAGSIGRLDSVIAKDIIRFHQLADAVVQDIRPGGPIANGAPLPTFREALAFMEKAIEIGSRVGTTP